MDTRALNYMNHSKGEITKDEFLDYLRVQKSGTRNMFGYNSDIQRNNNYETCYKWFIEKKQDISLKINILGDAETCLIEREDGTIWDPITGFDVDLS